MKTIFIFCEMPAAGRLRFVTALGEDGYRVRTICFDQHTVDHAGYVFGITHTLDASIEPDVASPLNLARRDTLAEYDRVYGRAGWIPVWLDNPFDEPAWRAAVARGLQAACGESITVPVPAPAQFSPEALARILAAVLSDAAASPRPTVH
jgi:hypothetical protein